MTNMAIRQKMMLHAVRRWQLAKAIGISEMTLYRWFRQELTGTRLERVEAALGSLCGKGGDSLHDE